MGKVLWNAAIAGGFAPFENPSEVEASDGRATFGAALEVVKNHAFGDRPWSARGDRRVGMAPCENQTFYRPGLATVKACPNGAVVTAIGAVAVAVD